MTLQVHRDRNHNSRTDPGVVDAVVSCDAWLVDECRTREELGEHHGWSDQQFHSLVTGAGHGWTFDPRSRRYLCPPCADADRDRRQPAALAMEGFGLPFGPLTASTGTAE